MALIAFDTLKACEKLEEAGVPKNHAHAYIDVLAEAAQVDVKNIATKEFIEERLRLLEARLKR